MDNTERYELNDEALDKVVGSIDVGDRVKVNAGMVRYCPGCGKLATKFTGKVVG